MISQPQPRQVQNDPPDPGTQWKTIPEGYTLDGIDSVHIYDGKIFGTRGKIQKTSDGENWSIYVGDNEKETYWGTSRAQRSYDVQGFNDKLFALSHHQTVPPTALLDMDSDGEKEAYAVVYTDIENLDKDPSEFIGPDQSSNPQEWTWKGAMRACVADEDCSQDSIDIKDYTDRGTALGLFKNKIYVSIGRNKNPDTPWIYRSSTGMPGDWELVFEPDDFQPKDRCLNPRDIDNSFLKIQTLFENDGNSTNDIIIATVGCSGISYWSHTGNDNDWHRVMDNYGEALNIELWENPIIEHQGIAYSTNPDTGELYYSSDGINWNPVPLDKFDLGTGDINIEVIGTITECEEYETNNPPVVTPNPVLTENINCCYSSPIVPFSWGYEDADGDLQAFYQLQVFEDADLRFDSGKIAYPPLTEHELSSLEFETPYSWQVKVWDERDTESSFRDGGTFTVPAKGPTVDFSCNGQSCQDMNFMSDQEIQFCSVRDIEEDGVCEEDLSVCYQGPCSWNWDFGDGNTSSEINPIHVYHSEPSYTVSLRVRDNLGKTCVKSQNIGVISIPLPKWQEARPSF